MVINVVAPADGNQMFAVNYNPLNGLATGSEFQGLYQISGIQSGGVARAIYSEQIDINLNTIGVLNTTIELFGKTLCVLYNCSGCSIQCSIDMFTCYSCYLPHCVFVDYYKQILFHTTHVHMSCHRPAIHHDISSVHTYVRVYVTYIHFITCVSSRPSRGHWHKCFSSSADRKISDAELYCECHPSCYCDMVQGQRDALQWDQYHL